MAALTDLPLETVASGIAGLLILGAIARQAFKGWIDAKAQSMNVGANAAAMVSAVAMGFDTEQRLVIMHGIERIAGALEAISISQAALADERKNNMDDKLDQLLEKLDDAEENKRRSRARPQSRR